MRKLISWIFLPLFILIGLGSANVNADPNADNIAKGPAGSSTTQSAARVHIDPKTGKLGGPPPGVEPPGLSIATQNRLSRSSKGLEKKTLPDGTVLVNLQGRFQNMSVVTVSPEDGKQFGCGHAIDHVEHALSHVADTANDHGRDKP
jgi:hypothetical protein